MEPVTSNSVSNTCPEPISSNCVTWAGDAITGLCGTNSITSVVQQLSSQITAVVIPGIPYTPGLGCLTGNWVNFSTSVPALSGTAGTFSWNILGFGNSLDFSTSIYTEGPISYKWTNSGNLEFRGVVTLQLQTLTPSTQVFRIALGSLSPTCLPVGFTYTQTHLVGVDSPQISQALPIFCKTYLQINPDSTMQLVVSVEWVTGFSGTFSTNLSFGGITFNLA